MSAVKTTKPLANYFVSNDKDIHVDNIKRAEIKLSVFFAEHNVATQVVDHLVALLKCIRKCETMRCFSGVARLL